jgi:sugar phosphate isomerase/epimerase
MSKQAIPRRSFLTLAAAAPLMASSSPAAAAKKRVPVGLEIYSVKDEEKKDMMGTLAAIAEMGYEGVEFWAPYLDWTIPYAQEVRKRLDALKLRCFSTHNRHYYFEPENFKKALERNQILGSKYVVMAHPGTVQGLDGWTKVAGILTAAADQLRPLGLRAGFHNHGTEWKPIAEGGPRPIDVLASSTPKDFAFQVDTATCLAAGGDPVAFVKANPGRVKSYHLKDWSPEPDKGYKVLLGEGIGPWKKLVQAAESVGGVDYYLIEQEGSRFPPMETAKRCLDSFRKLRG